MSFVVVYGIFFCTDKKSAKNILGLQKYLQFKPKLRGGSIVSNVAYVIYFLKCLREFKINDERKMISYIEKKSCRTLIHQIIYIQLWV